jgi:hypothetical protein
MIAENQYVHLGAQEAIECLRRAADDRPFSLNDVGRRAVRRAKRGLTHENSKRDRRNMSHPGWAKRCGVNQRCASWVARSRADDLLRWIHTRERPASCRDPVWHPQKIADAILYAEGTALTIDLPRATAHPALRSIRSSSSGCSAALAPVDVRICA